MPDKKPTLQDDLKRLEEVVRQLEAEDIDLDKGIALFEEGIKRLRSAREQLASVEQRVQKVLEQAGGELTLTDLDPE
jgi:exodeoxyribonuclease VII small subunit